MWRDEVILTRRTDEFVVLQERTAMANREGADLFLSPFPSEMKQSLLEQLDVTKRVGQLINLIDCLRPNAAELIAAVGGPNRQFPPEFSRN